MQHLARAPAHSHIPCFQHLERHQRGPGEVAQLVGEEAETLEVRGLAAHARLVPGAPELADGSRDRVVQAAIQRAEVLGADGRVRFHRQLGDGLAHVSVVVDDLRDGEPLQEKIVPVQNRAGADFLG